MDEGLLFQKLKLLGWRQFSALDIEFHPNLTVLTGANGSGKSTLLNILSRQLGGSRPFLSTPQISKNGQTLYESGILPIRDVWAKFFSSFSWKRPNNRSIGEITYSNGRRANLAIPSEGRVQYEIDVENAQTVIGLHISSHRTLSRYEPLGDMPFAGIDPDVAFSSFHNQSHQRHIGGDGHQMLLNIKKTLATWAIVGDGNKHLVSNERQKSAFSGFNEILRKILPVSLGFKSIAIRPPEVVILSDTGEFMLDAASGGIATLIEIAALIYACSLRSDIGPKRFIVTIDEPENHLHPTLQRTLLPNLLQAFPRTQFIIATHSPFMVSSVKNSNVYALKYETIESLADEEIGVLADETLGLTNRVRSHHLDYVNRAGPASEILHEVLGVPSMLPGWVEDEISAIVETYRGKTISSELLQELNAKMSEFGLGDLYSRALIKLANVK